MASLYEVMGSNKSPDKISMGYEVTQYNDFMKQLFMEELANVTYVSNGSGTLAGSYVPSLNELVESSYDLTTLNFNSLGFAIGDDEIKRIASLKFVPRRAYVAAGTKEGYALIKVKETIDNVEVCGHSVCGNYVSPPASLAEDIINQGKTNSEEGSYRVGCSIDVEGMFKNYLIHFYPNENIGKGLKDGTITNKCLLRLVAERCLYAEVTFPVLSKTTYMSVTDSYKMLGANENYIHIDAPLCVSSTFSDVFFNDLDEEKYKPVNIDSSYDFKKGKLDLCDTEKYSLYSKEWNKETIMANIKLKFNANLGVRFFSFTEKREQVERILGKMPDDFFKPSSDFTYDHAKAVNYSGIEFVRGEVTEARKNFYEERGPVPDSFLSRLRSCYANFITKRNDYLFNKEFIKSGQNAVVGENCGYFIIPSGYPIALGERFFNRGQVVKEITTRDLSALKDSRMLDYSYNGASSKFLRGYNDSVYDELYELAKGEVAIKCNKHLADLLTNLFQCILDYYGGKNLPKIAPSLCVLTCGIRSKDDAQQAGICHRTGKALDFDYYNNWGNRGAQTFNKGKNTNYKGFLDMVKASGCPWPISSGGQPDWMHFQWK